LVILRKPVARLSEAELARFVTKACRAVKLRGSVNVMVTSSQEMRSLNRRFRGKDRATDVLSFPPIAGFANGLAGDLAISAEIAGKNARALRHAPSDEVKILVLHGVLHLAGYDHETDNGQMARKEQLLRRRFGLAESLIARSNGHARRKVKR